MKYADVRVEVTLTNPGAPNPKILGRTIYTVMDVTVKIPAPPADSSYTDFQLEQLVRHAVMKTLPSMGVSDPIAIRQVLESTATT